MKNKRNVLFSLMIMLVAVVNFTGQSQYAVDSKEVFISQAPPGIVRTIKQDSKGTIWVTSWEGVYKYDGNFFTNVTSKVSSARFFSILEDRKGNLWFGSIGSGVYYYDGKSFQNFTTKDGLVNNSVTNIYEDKTGTIWFGTLDGVSLYNGRTLLTGQPDFRNLKMSETPPVTATDSVFIGTKAIRSEADSVQVSVYQNSIPKDHWTNNDVNAIVEDNTGKFWMGTRGNAFFYDGKMFTTIINNGKPFTNVRTIIKDKKGNIWLGGNDGLWRYDGRTFTNFSQDFVGYIYEDKKGNIWTSSETKNKMWALSRYNGKTLSDNKPTVNTIANKPMTFGILEDDKGNIWFGDLDGVHLYDGKTITDFKS